MHCLSIFFFSTHYSCYLEDLLKIVIFFMSKNLKKGSFTKKIGTWLACCSFISYVFVILKTDSDQAGSGESIYSLQLSREHDKNQEHPTLGEDISSLTNQKRRVTYFPPRV
jgi:hypothetical protein